MRQVSESCDALLAALRQQEKMLGLLLDCSREKEICLIALDDEGLYDILSREQEAAFALREQEDARDRAARELAAAAGAANGPVTISALCGYMRGGADRQALISAGQKLTRAMSALKLQNSKVGALLRRRLDYTDYMFDLLSAPCSKAHFYNVRGSREERAGTVSRLDYHV